MPKKKNAPKVVIAISVFLMIILVIPITDVIGNLNMTKYGVFPKAFEVMLSLIPYVFIATIMIGIIGLVVRKEKRGN